MKQRRQDPLIILPYQDIAHILYLWNIPLNSVWEGEP